MYSVIVQRICSVSRFCYKFLVQLPCYEAVCKRRFYEDMRQNLATEWMGRSVPFRSLDPQLRDKLSKYGDTAQRWRKEGRAEPRNLCCANAHAHLCAIVVYDIIASSAVSLH